MNKFLFAALFGSVLCADVIQNVGIDFGYSKLASIKNNGGKHNDIIDGNHIKKEGGKFMVGLNYGIGSEINDTFSLRAEIFANFNNTKKEYYTNVGSYSQYKIKNSIGVMPIAELKIHDNVSVFVGCGVASTKVKEKHGIIDINADDDHFKTSKRKCGFTYKIGFDVKPTDTFSFGVAYQSIKTKIKFNEDTDPRSNIDNIIKSKASAKVNNVTLTFKYHF